MRKVLFFLLIASAFTSCASFESNSVAASTASIIVPATNANYPDYKHYPVPAARQNFPGESYVAQLVRSGLEAMNWFSDASYHYQEQVHNQRQ